MELSFGEIKKPDKIQIVFVYTPLQTQMLELLGKAYALYEDCSKLLTLLRKQHRVYASSIPIFMRVLQPSISRVELLRWMEVLRIRAWCKCKREGDSFGGSSAPLSL